MKKELELTVFEAIKTTITKKYIKVFVSKKGYKYKL
jgi:hypothetical protein